MVERDPSGVWVGSVDYRHVGGPCVPAEDKLVSSEVRAVIVGEDFFARVTNVGGGTCLVNGRVRGFEIRGASFCSGSPDSTQFALRLNRN